MYRRNFLNLIALASGTLVFNPVHGFQAGTSLSEENELLPNVKRLIPDPVIIRDIALLKYDGLLILKVTDKNGRWGCTLCNQRMPNLVSLLHGLVIPNFTGKDARDIEALLERVYVADSNYKYTGMPFWNSVGHVEIAIFDLLGKIAGVPVHRLLGKKVKDELDLYISSTTRETTPEEEAARFAEKLGETGARAVKFKVGGRMSKNADASPGRSDTIVPVMRKTLGDNITFYVDANGSYDLENGIRMARYLEEQNVDIFEEPVPFDEYENTLGVTKSVKKIRLAGGEQDTSLYRFDWLARNKALDVLQPDLYYNGGFIRCLRVARMTEKAGLGFSPHSPKNDPVAAPMLHLMAVVPNSGGFQEWNIVKPNFKNWYLPHYTVKNGKIRIPDDPGLGILFDESIWKKAVIIH
jgi:L-alanine-DL-glutamate epimerase-like enolase superfamily enzyme